MKKIILSALLLAGISSFAGAQAPVSGHISFEELVYLMPEMDSARVSLQAYANDLQETLQAMEDEYNTKLTEYQRKSATWTPAVQKTKEEDIQNLIQRIQQFQQTAQQEMQQQEQKLSEPCYNKAKAAVEKVAKANNLTYVFMAGTLLYVDTAKSLDLMPLAKKELGIPAEKVAPSQIPAAGAQAPAAR